MPSFEDILAEIESLPGPGEKDIDVAEEIKLAAANTSIDPFAAIAYSKRESGLDPRAKNPTSTAYGPFQFIKGTAAGREINRFSPKENVQGGVKYMEELYTKYDGDYAKVFAALNMGEPMVDIAAEKFGEEWHSRLHELADKDETGVKKQAENLPNYLKDINKYYKKETGRNLFSLDAGGLDFESIMAEIDALPNAEAIMKEIEALPSGAFPQGRPQKDVEMPFQREGEIVRKQMEQGDRPKSTGSYEPAFTLPTMVSSITELGESKAAMEKDIVDPAGKFAAGAMHGVGAAYKMAGRGFTALEQKKKEVPWENKTPEEKRTYFDAKNSLEEIGDFWFDAAERVRDKKPGDKKRPRGDEAKLDQSNIVGKVIEAAAESAPLVAEQAVLTAAGGPALAILGLATQEGGNFIKDGFDFADAAKLAKTGELRHSLTDKESEFVYDIKKKVENLSPVYGLLSGTIEYFGNAMGALRGIMKAAPKGSKLWTAAKELMGIAGEGAEEVGQGGLQDWLMASIVADVEGKHKTKIPGWEKGSSVQRFILGAGAGAAMRGGAKTLEGAIRGTQQTLAPGAKERALSEPEAIEDRRLKMAALEASMGTPEQQARNAAKQELYKKQAFKQEHLDEGELLRQRMLEKQAKFEAEPTEQAAMQEQFDAALEETKEEGVVPQVEAEVEDVDADEATDFENKFLAEVKEKVKGLPKRTKKTEGFYKAIEEEVRSKLEVKHKSRADQLTKLRNKTALDDDGFRNDGWFNKETKEIEERPTVFLDADHFKKVNDTWGHAAGNEYLKTLGKIVRKNTKGTGIISYRFGGEEILLTSFDKSQQNAILDITEKIRNDLEKTKFSFDPEYRASISAGFGNSINEADAQLYKAKTGGRGYTSVGGERYAGSKQIEEQDGVRAGVREVREGKGLPSTEKGVIGGPEDITVGREYPERQGIKPEETVPVAPFGKPTTGGPTTGGPPVEPVETKVEIEGPETRKKGMANTVLESGQVAPELKAAFATEHGLEYQIERDENVDAESNRVLSQGETVAESYLETAKPGAVRMAVESKLLDNYDAKIGEAETAGNKTLAETLTQKFTALLNKSDTAAREMGRGIRQIGRLWHTMKPATYRRLLLRLSKEYNIVLDENYVRGVQDQIKAIRDEFTSVQAELKRLQESGATKEEIAKMQDRVDETFMKRENAMKNLLNQIAEEVDKKLPLRKKIPRYLEAYYYQNILSGPRTHIRNLENNQLNKLITSPSSIAATNAYELMGAIFDPALRDASLATMAKRIVTEPTKYYRDVTSVKNNMQAIQAAGMTFKTGELEPKYQEIGPQSDYIGQKIRTRVPGYLSVVSRALTAADAFDLFTLTLAEKNRLMQRNAESNAYRESKGLKKEVLTEREAAEQGENRAKDLLYRRKIGEDSKTPGVSIPVKMVDALAYQMLRASNYRPLKIPMKIATPFVTVPTNVAKMTIEFSPFGFAGNVKKMTKDQVAKAFLGSMITAIGGLLMASGRAAFMPPKDKELKDLWYASGRKPNSIKIGNKWVPAWYFGPFALALMAPEIIRHYAEEDENVLADNWAQQALNVGLGLTRFYAEMTPMDGLESVIGMVMRNDDVTMGKTAAFRVQGLVPASGFIRQMSQMFLDPVFRKSSDFEESFRKDVDIITSFPEPYSKKLEPHTTPMGEPAKRGLSRFMPYDIGSGNEFWNTMYKNALVAKQHESYFAAMEKKMEKKLKKEIRAGM